MGDKKKDAYGPYPHFPFCPRWESLTSYRLLPHSPCEQAQIPSDLVVKTQAIEIVEIIS